MTTYAVTRQPTEYSPQRNLQHATYGLDGRSLTYCLNSYATFLMTSLEFGTQRSRFALVALMFPSSFLSHAHIMHDYE